MNRSDAPPKSNVIAYFFTGSRSHVTFFFFLGSDSHVIGMCSICATGGQYQAPVITNSMHCRQEKREKNMERFFMIKRHSKPKALQENFT